MLFRSYDLGDGWNIVGHLGSFKLKNWSTGARGTNGDYTDLKLGVTKDISGWVLGASYVTTSSKGSCTAIGGATEFYCFGNSAAGATKFKDAGASTIVFSVNKSF